MPRKEDLKEYEVINEADVVEKFDSVEEDYETASKQKGTDQVVEGGPTYDQLEDWKSRYNGEIYMSDFGEDVFFWRPLRRKEFKDISRIEGIQGDQFYMDESICRTAVLWPENFAAQKMAFGKAGIPTTLSTLITENSGFNRPVTYKV